MRVNCWRTGAFWGFWDAVVYCGNITNSMEICHTLAHFCGFADGCSMASLDTIEVMILLASWNNSVGLLLSRSASRSTPPITFQQVLKWASATWVIALCRCWWNGPLVWTVPSPLRERIVNTCIKPQPAPVPNYCLWREFANAIRRWNQPNMGTSQSRQ